MTVVVQDKTPRVAALGVLALGLALAAPGCGSKSGLYVPEYDMDAAVPIDGFVPPPPPDAFIPDAGPEPPDVCIELPPREPPDEVLVSFVSRILSADVFFLVDVTGSMGEEIDQVRRRLSDTIIPGIVEQIPDVRFSVGHFADYPQSPYGQPRSPGGMDGDEVFRMLATSTSDVATVQRAVDRLELQSGGDGPECATEALYLTATGAALPGLVPARSCPTGTVGHPCFAREGSRIILLITDAATHNGPGGSNRYGADLDFESHTYDQAMSELRAIGAKVLGLYSGSGFDEGRADLQAIARDTGAVRPDGEPIIFDIGSSGGSLGPDVVEAVRTLVEEVPIDVDALVEDFPGDAFDATDFVVGIDALRAEPADGAINRGDRFDEVTPGTRVTFRIRLANESIERGPEPQIYRMTIVLRGDRVTRLQTTVVDVVIPSLDGEGCPDM